MSDQPEWTADRIYGYGVSDADFGVRLAKDVNAALAAERENTHQALELLRKEAAAGARASEIIAMNEGIEIELREANQRYYDCEVKLANLQSQMNTAQQNYIRRLNELTK